MARDGGRGATLAWRALERARRRFLSNRMGSAAYRLARPDKPRFACPLCGYEGPFADAHPETGVRRHALCPRCGSAERHRLQFLVLERIASARDLAALSLLHVAPEHCMRGVLRARFGCYFAVDLDGARSVDRRADLRALPFRDGTYDFVFASHVLEHIREDDAALSEIRRVLRPGGIACLPVPILGARTVEYSEPNPHEAGHVRAPGLDYFDRLRRHFRRVDLYDSGCFDERYQTHVHEDRTGWPPTMPLRPTAAGSRHPDVTPVCFA